MATKTIARPTEKTGGTLDIPVSGMSCASCVGRVEKAIRALEPVDAVAVNLATERARVTLRPGVTDPEPVLQAIRKAGYEPATARVELSVSGMTCASCVGRVEKALRKVPGVVDAAVNLATGRAVVTVAGTPVPALLDAVNRAGYEAAGLEETGQRDREQQARENEEAGLRRDVVLAAIATIPLVVLEMGSHLVESFHHALAGRFGETNLRLVAFALASFVILGPGLRFQRKGWPALFRFAPDMNSLVALGTAAAYGYSVAATFFPGILPDEAEGTYFEAGAVVVTLILLGRLFEARARGQTSQAIRHLLRLQPPRATVLRDGAEIEVDVSAVRTGDIVVVRPGERVAVDGTVVEGTSYVDEAMITGEPVPVAKSAGAEVIGGSVNTTGALQVRATRVGAETLLAQIIRTVEAAQGSKLPIQGVVDKITLWFVPAVMGLATLTFVAWLAFGPSPAFSHALVNAVAVLIIACPCAMGLATPTSIMVGTGKAAELGVLFRRGEALQALRDATIVALDKTGTLTRGRPELTDIVASPGLSENEALRLAAAVEGRSEHPIAAAVVAAARARSLAMSTAEGFAAEPGFGASAVVEGRRVAVGSRRLMQRMGIDTAALDAAFDALGAQGKTPLFVAVDGALGALLAVADAVKDGTPEALAALRALGLRLVMVTGDSRRTAQAIAAQLGIDEVVAEVLPTDKARVVADLAAKGASVAFVGDGINDAPALARADVGIALGTGTDIAIESADVVLMSGDLRGVANAIALSHACMRNVRQNLAWAFGYNVVLIPLAAGALYPFAGVQLSPMVAGLAMALSSVSVVANALRLNGFRGIVQAQGAGGAS